MAEKKGKYAASKSKTKNPFYKRWWFWVIALILCSGGCTSHQDLDATTTNPLPTETTVATEISALTTVIPTTETEVIETTTIPTTEATIIESTTAQIETECQISYVLNTNSMKFHYPDCNGAEKIADHNRREFAGTREEVIAQGYDSCGICTP